MERELEKIKKQNKVAWRMYFMTKELLIKQMLESKITDSLKNRLKSLIKNKPDYFEEKCSICLEELKGKICMLKCGCYNFHSECIEQLEKCPLCRKENKIFVEIEC